MADDGQDERGQGSHRQKQVSFWISYVVILSKAMQFKSAEGICTLEQLLHNLFERRNIFAITDRIAFCQILKYLCDCVACFEL